MSIVFVGIDLAKNVFAVHGVNEAGKLLELVASLPPCTIGLEACSGAHHWARQFTAHGHTVRLIAVETCIPKASGLQSARFAARINCIYRPPRARIKCH